MKVSTANGKRFAVFRQEGWNLCLPNGLYDEQHPEQKYEARSYKVNPLSRVVDIVLDLADTAGL